MSDSVQSLPQILGEAIDVLAKYSIPLYVDDGYGRPDQFGTGFFVRASGAHFLVSAAHVLDVMRTKRVFFYSAPAALSALTGKILATSTPESLEQDDLDVGVLRWAGNPSPPYPGVDKFSVDMSDLTPSYVPRSGKHYVIVGYPATQSYVHARDRTALSTPYAYRSDSIADNDYAVKGLSPNTHVVLPLDLKKGFDTDGRRRAFPKPQGMSGSPIVVLYESGEDQPPTFPVVAIGTRYVKRDKVLIGTDVRFALEMIEQFLRG